MALTEGSDVSGPVLNIAAVWVVSQVIALREVQSRRSSDGSAGELPTRSIANAAPRANFFFQPFDCALENGNIVSDLLFGFFACPKEESGCLGQLLIFYRLDDLLKVSLLRSISWQSSTPSAKV